MTLPRKIPVVTLARLDPGEIVESLETCGVVVVDRSGTGQAEFDRLCALARTYFEQPDDVKRSNAMSRYGSAWRGWFGVGDELTAGHPDAKEGLYFGSDLTNDEPGVVARRPMHGANPEPTGVPELREAVADWMKVATAIGLDLLSAVALGLGLHGDWFTENWCAEPTLLFRIFRYPGVDASAEASQGVGRHTDYGLLTVLANDGVPGLEVEIDGDWVAMPSDPHLLVVNVGDMLERATAGRLRSAPHRVVSSTRDRYSFPLFVDPGWDTVVQPLPGFDAVPLDDPVRYGDYLLDKVSRVFPELFRDQFGTGR